MTRQSKRRKKRRQLARRLRDRLLEVVEKKEKYYGERKNRTDYDCNRSYWREMKARAEGHGAAKHHVSKIEAAGADPVDSLVRQVLKAFAFADTMDGNWPDRFNRDIRSDIRHVGQQFVDWAVELGWTPGRTLSRVFLMESGGATDLRLAEADDLQQWTLAVDELLARSGPGSRPSVSLSPPPPRGMSVPDAFHVLVDSMDRARWQGREMLVLVDSERAIGPLARHVPGDGRCRAAVRTGGARLTLMSGEPVGLRADAMVLPCGTTDAYRRWPAMGWRVRSPLEKELDGLCAGRPLEPGDVVVTGSHGLPHVPLVLHAAVQGEDAAVLTAALERVLAVAVQRDLRALVMPALDTGELTPSQRAAALQGAVDHQRAASGARDLPELFVTCGAVEDYEIFVEVLSPQEPLIPAVHW